MRRATKRRMTRTMKRKKMRTAKMLIVVQMMLSLLAATNRCK
jgi:hypothetical protein